MPTEFEAKIIKIDKDQIREKLKEFGAEMVYAERFMKRYVIDTPQMRKEAKFIRIRDEGDKITLSYKHMRDETSVDGMKEITVEVDSFEETKEIFIELGYEVMAYQESKREEWKLENIIFDIDTWPKVDPWLEIEGPDAQTVQSYVEKLGFKWDDCYFGTATVAYREVYGIDILTIKELRF